MTLQLPGLIENRDCNAFGSTPVGMLIDDVFLIQLAAPRAAAQHYSVAIREIPQTDEQRRAAATQFASESSALPTRSASTHAVAMPTGASPPTSYEVHFADGRRIAIFVSWEQVRQYDVSNRPDPRLRAHVDETTQRLLEVAARTLAPAGSPPQGVPTRATLVLPTRAMPLSLAPGVFARPIDYFTNEIEVGPAFDTHCASYELFVHGAGPRDQCAGTSSVCVRGCEENGDAQRFSGAALGVVGRGPSTDPRLLQTLDSGRSQNASPQAPSPTASSPSCVWVVEDPAPPLNVRAERSSRSSVVGTLANGTELTFLERSGRWGRIEAPVAGWVFTQNVRERCEAR